jgi:hypothetical protein
MITAHIAEAIGQTQAREQSSVILRENLLDIRQILTRYVVLGNEQATACALWTVATHLLDAFDYVAYLQITSATKQCGKSRLFEVLDALVARPWFTARVTAAVLVRKVDAEHPTLLLDESDQAFKSDKEYAAALTGILNSGYQRSGKVSLCVGQGANLSYRDFSTFGAKAIAGIGQLPDTITDRCIRIELKRRTADEPIEKWRHRDGHAEALPVRVALESLVTPDLIELLRSARPMSPTGLSDRQEDVWEPLFAIAEFAGGDWPEQARRAALVLSGSVEDQDIKIQLLEDIATILHESDGDFIPTKDLIAGLVERDDKPWATWKHDRPITPKELAQLLGPLRIHPTRLEHVRGYRVDAFNDAIGRYLPLEASLRQNHNKTGSEPPIVRRQDAGAADESRCAVQTDFHWRNDAMTEKQSMAKADDHAGEF